jgi:hypothetical protein
MQLVRTAGWEKDGEWRADVRFAAAEHISLIEVDTECQRQEIVIVVDVHVGDDHTPEFDRVDVVAECGGNAGATVHQQILSTAREEVAGVRLARHADHAMRADDREGVYGLLSDQFAHHARAAIE